MTDDSGARRIPPAALERELRCRSCGSTFDGLIGETQCGKCGWQAELDRRSQQPHDAIAAQ